MFNNKALTQSMVWKTPGSLLTMVRKTKGNRCERWTEGWTHGWDVVWIIIHISLPLFLSNGHNGIVAVDQDPD